MSMSRESRRLASDKENAETLVNATSAIAIKLRAEAADIQRLLIEASPNTGNTPTLLARINAFRKDVRYYFAEATEKTCDPGAEEAMLVAFRTSLPPIAILPEQKSNLQKWYDIATWTDNVNYVQRELIPGGASGPTLEEMQTQGIGLRLFMEHTGNVLHSTPTNPPLVDRTNEVTAQRDLQGLGESRGTKLPREIQEQVKPFIPILKAVIQHVAKSPTVKEEENKHFQNVEQLKRDVIGLKRKLAQKNPHDSEAVKIRKKRCLIELNKLGDPRKWKSSPDEHAKFSLKTRQAVLLCRLQDIDSETKRMIGDQEVARETTFSFSQIDHSAKDVMQIINMCKDLDLIPNCNSLSGKYKKISQSQQDTLNIVLDQLDQIRKLQSKPKPLTEQSQLEINIAKQIIQLHSSIMNSFFGNDTRRQQIKALQNLQSEIKKFHDPKMAIRERRDKEIAAYAEKNKLPLKALHQKIAKNQTLTDIEKGAKRIHNYHEALLNNPKEMAIEKRTAASQMISLNNVIKNKWPTQIKGLFSAAIQYFKPAPPSTSAPAKHHNGAGAISQGLAVNPATMSHNPHVALDFPRQEVASKEIKDDRKTTPESSQDRAVATEEKKRSPETDLETKAEAIKNPTPYEKLEDACHHLQAYIEQKKVQEPLLVGLPSLSTITSCLHQLHRTAKKHEVRPTPESLDFLKRAAERARNESERLLHGEAKEQGPEQSPKKVFTHPAASELAKYFDHWVKQVSDVIETEVAPAPQRSLSPRYHE